MVNAKIKKINRVVQEMAAAIVFRTGKTFAAAGT